YPLLPGPLDWGSKEFMFRCWLSKFVRVGWSSRDKLLAPCPRIALQTKFTILDTEIANVKASLGMLSAPESISAVPLFFPQCLMVLIGKKITSDGVEFTVQTDLFDDVGVVWQSSLYFVAPYAVTSAIPVAPPSNPVDVDIMRSTDETNITIGLACSQERLAEFDLGGAVDIERLNGWWSPSTPKVTPLWLLAAASSAIEKQGLEIVFPVMCHAQANGPTQNVPPTSDDLTCEVAAKTEDGSTKLITFNVSTSNRPALVSGHGGAGFSSEKGDKDTKDKLRASYHDLSVPTVTIPETQRYTFAIVLRNRYQVKDILRERFPGKAMKATRHRLADQVAAMHLKCLRRLVQAGLGVILLDNDNSIPHENQKYNQTNNICVLIDPYKDSDLLLQEFKREKDELAIKRGQANARLGMDTMESVKNICFSPALELQLTHNIIHNAFRDCDKDDWVRTVFMPLLLV
ncbi:hypothetical protein DYB28_007643, partial [Aphanomyces astaci]